MNAILGTGGVLLAFLAALGGVATLLAGLALGRPARVGAGWIYPWLVLLGAVVSVAAMQSALLGDDFSLTYVAENSARTTPLLYKVATMWAALEGSILLWGLVLAGYLAAVA